jgi:N6-L-threonylcarbamoyladenine synthase
MKILAIETSCDDTGVAVLSAQGGPASGGEVNFEVLANIVTSQFEMGQKYGGVYPIMAKREHEKNLQPTLETALKQAKTSLENIDLIAVTNGPGLEPCLWVGVNFAKNLSEKYNISLVPINHIEGHILVNFLGNKNIKFPAIALVVSGGHTQIILVEKISKYKILGETRDDAAGECFDKCAKLLGLGYPGGQIISEYAKKSKPGIIKLPRPMINTKDYDFSFSGLKTAVLYADRKISDKNLEYKEAMAAEVQQAIIDVLIKKTMKAVGDYKAKTLILGGGVSANAELRKQFQEAINNKNANQVRFLPRGKKRTELNLIFPTSNLSTDNGLMIAIAGYFNRKKSARSDLAQLKADGNLRIGK